MFKKMLPVVIKLATNLSGHLQLITIDPLGFSLISYSFYIMKTLHFFWRLGGTIQFCKTIQTAKRKKKRLTMVKSLLDYKVKTTLFWKPGNSNYNCTNRNKSPKGVRETREQREKNMQTLRQTSNS